MPKKRKVAVHQMRERRACFGELVQIDGSPHAWFEQHGPSCSLLVVIDDATGKLVGLLFVEQESFHGYARLAKAYFEGCGKPVAFYSDKHSIFRVNSISLAACRRKKYFTNIVRHTGLNWTVIAAKPV